ncbi:MAG: sigma-70 family RNA polymerase sigma factor [Pirellulales bacterium]|nr:sigma-70 family RNA polymerase sigma factor [Pirellulales bacterium]
MSTLKVSKSQSCGQKTSQPTATGGSAEPIACNGLPDWLCGDELEAASVAADRQLGGQDYSPMQVEMLTRRWLKREIGFISNSLFSEPSAGETIFSEPLELQSLESETGFSAVRAGGTELPIHLRRMCRAALLKPEQERQLFQRMNFLLHQAAMHRSQLDPDRPSLARLQLVERLVAMAEWHRDRIVEANVRLVFSVVKKFISVNNHFDDLLSDGIMGLIRAVEKFDFDRGFRFSTYATQVLRRSAYRAVVTKQQERQKVLGGLQDMEIEITDEQRCSLMSEKRWSLLRNRLTSMLNDLDRREKLIIRARFALGSHRSVRTLQSLADRLGISKERVRQLEKRAMEKLQAMAGVVPAEVEA